MSRFLVPIGLLLGLATGLPARGQDAAPPDGGYAITQSAPDLNTNIRRAAVRGSSIPFDKPWSALSPAERNAIRELYEAMPADEEPPFPLSGLGGVYRPMSDALDRHADAYHGVRGAWHLAVTVSPQGQVVAFTIIEAPDEDLARVIGHDLLAVRFKPGLCKGRPCQMDFPIDLAVTTR